MQICLPSLVKPLNPHTGRLHVSVGIYDRLTKYSTVYNKALFRFSQTTKKHQFINRATGDHSSVPKKYLKFKMGKMAVLPVLTPLLFYTVFCAHMKDNSFQNFQRNQNLGQTMVSTAFFRGQSYQRMIKTPQDMSGLVFERQICNKKINECFNYNNVGASVIDILDVLHLMPHKTARVPFNFITKDNKPLQMDLWKYIFKPPV